MNIKELNEEVITLLNEEFVLTPKDMIYYNQYVPEGDYHVYTFIGTHDGKALLRKGYDGFDKSKEVVRFELDDKFTPADSHKSRGIDPVPNYMLQKEGPQRNTARINYIKQHGKPSQYESLTELDNIKEHVTVDNENSTKISEALDSTRYSKIARGILAVKIDMQKYLSKDEAQTLKDAANIVLKCIKLIETNDKEK